VLTPNVSFGSQAEILTLSKSGRHYLR
jgi:hypothetical protein